MHAFCLIIVKTVNHLPLTAVGSSRVRGKKNHVRKLSKVVLLPRCLLDHLKCTTGHHGS